MQKYKKIILNILILFLPLIIGTIIGMCIDSTKVNSIIPTFIFPVVWTILYILMGVSSYIIYKEQVKIPKVYIIQLLVNYLWIFIFFTLDNYLLAFIWIILLILLVIKMIKEFYQINKLSAYLQIPYLIWLMIAAFLNLTYII